MEKPVVGGDGLAFHEGVAVRVVDRIVGDLVSRDGLRQAWDGIDLLVREGIVARWRALVVEELVVEELVKKEDGEKKESPPSFVWGRSFFVWDEVCCEVTETVIPETALGMLGACGGLSDGSSDKSGDELLVWLRFVLDLLEQVVVGSGGVPGYRKQYHVVSGGKGGEGGEHRILVMRGLFGRDKEWVTAYCPSCPALGKAFLEVYNGVWCAGIPEDPKVGDFDEFAEFTLEEEERAVEWARVIASWPGVWVFLDDDVEE